MDELCQPVNHHLTHQNHTLQPSSLPRLRTQPSASEGTWKEPAQSFNQILPQKLGILTVVGVLVYSYYVLVHTILIPGLRQSTRTWLRDRSESIGLLVVLSFLCLMFLWSYLRIVITPAGFAKDHIPTSDPPFEALSGSLNSSSETDQSSLRPGRPYDSILNEGGGGGGGGGELNDGLTGYRVSGYDDAASNPAAEQLPTSTTTNLRSTTTTTTATTSQQSSSSTETYDRSSVEGQRQAQSSKLSDDEEEPITPLDGTSDNLTAEIATKNIALRPGFVAARSIAVVSPAGTHDTGLTKVEPEVGDSTLVAMERHRQSLLLKITPVVVEDEDGDVQKDGGMISPEIVNSAPFYLPSSSSSHHGYYLHQLNRSTDSEGNQGTSNGDRHQMMSLRNQNVSRPLSEPESLNQTNNNTQNVKTKEGFDRLNTTGSSKLAGAVRTIRLITRIVMVRLKGFFPNDKDVDDFLISSGQGLDRTFVDSITDVRGRYCRKCRLVKPLRSHHCRHCGKCVLKMDHHCPWVGRCVGARNFKFFFNFLQWAFLYCSYVFATVLAVNIRNQTSSSSPSERLNLDGQHVSILVLSGLFMTFTISLLVTHFFLMSFNLSTIEHMNLTRNKKREERRIESFLRIELDRQREHNQKDDDEKRKDKRKWFWRQDGDVNLLRQFFKVRKARRIIVRRFDREWGSPLREANPFSRGSWKKNFEEIMGLSKAAWICNLF